MQRFIEPRKTNNMTNKEKESLYVKIEMIQKEPEFYKKRAERIQFTKDYVQAEIELLNLKFKNEKIIAWIIVVISIAIIALLSINI